MFSEIYSTLSANPAILALLSGFLMYLCKSLPLKIYYFILDSLTLNLTIYQDNNYRAYESIDSMLNNSKLWYITGRFQLVYKWMHKKLDMSVGEDGIFLTKIAGCWAIVIKRTDTQVQFWRQFSYSIRFLSKDKNKIEEFLQKNFKYQSTLSSSNEIKVYHYISDWNSTMRKKIDSPIITSDDREMVKKRIAYFLNNEEKYNERNKPYKEGIILYGKPGCGKSFFIMQLASMFDLNIYYLNLNEFTSEADFLKAILSIDNPSILLIEDIDCVTSLKPRESTKKESTRDKIKKIAKEEKENSEESKNGLSMSTILNVLDGILSQEGQITVITTNHIENLDPALIRAGRFDSKVEFDYLNSECAALFLRKWYFNNEIKLDFKISISIADLSNVCSKYDNYLDCLDYLENNFKI